MTRAWLCALLVMGAAQARADELTTIRGIFAAHCVRCHDGDTSFDLREPPPLTESRRWTKILQMVEEAKMPPAKENGTIAERFPMDPAVRAKLIEALTTLLGDELKIRARAQHLSSPAWRNIVDELGQRVGLTDLPKRLDAPFDADSPPRFLLPTYVLWLRETSFKACAQASEAELGRVPAQRKLIPGSAPASRRGIVTAGPWRREAVSSLHGLVFGEAPGDAALRKDVALLDRAQRASGSWVDGWTALCAIYLSGPRLQYLFSEAVQ
jgi:hypothetical protein